MLTLLLVAGGLAFAGGAAAGVLSRRVPRLKKHPYTGAVLKRYDWARGKQLITTEWNVRRDETPAAREELRRQMEAALREDGWGVTVEDKIVWSERNPRNALGWELPYEGYSIVSGTVAKSL